MQDKFAAEDFVSVSTVSVDIPGGVALEILEARSEPLSDPLRQIFADRDLVDVESAEIVSTWPARRLETELLSIHGLGATKVSKLIARKRPRLVPVYDTLVRALVRPVGGFWASLNAELRHDDHALHHHLIPLRDEAGIGDDISPLSVFDVVAWRTAKDEGLVVTAEPENLARRRNVDSQHPT